MNNSIRPQGLVAQRIAQYEQLGQKSRAEEIHVPRRGGSSVSSSLAPTKKSEEPSKAEKVEQVAVATLPQSDEKYALATKSNENSLLHSLPEDISMAVVSYLELKDQSTFSLLAQKLHQITLNYYFNPIYFGDADSKLNQSTYGHYKNGAPSFTIVNLGRNYYLQMYTHALQSSITHQLISKLLNIKFADLPFIETEALNNVLSSDYITYVRADEMTDRIMQGRDAKNRQCVFIKHRKIMRLPDNTQEVVDCVWAIHERHATIFSSLWVNAGVLPLDSYTSAIFDKGKIQAHDDYEAMRKSIRELGTQ